jgi:hypothetical protein
MDGLVMLASLPVTHVACLEVKTRRVLELGLDHNLAHQTSSVLVSLCNKINVQE